MMVALMAMKWDEELAGLMVDKTVGILDVQSVLWMDP